MCMAEDAGELWDAILARGVTPCGLGARDTLRLEVCYPLHGNDIGPQWDAISSGLGWACALDTEFTGVERLREVKAAGPEQKLVPFTMTEKAIPRQGMAIEGGGEVTSGTMSPMLEVGIGMAYVPAARAAPGTELVIDVRGKPRARGSAEEAPLPEGALRRWRASRTPKTCCTTPSTTGRASRATRRCSASPGSRQDALGELVHYEPPDVGATVAKDASYGEVESVKAVSDLISPLSGEVIEVNQAVVDAPETVNEDPYGDGWLIRIRLERTRASVDAAASTSRRRYQEQVVGRRQLSYLSLTDADREAMLAAIGVSSVDELFRDIPRAHALRARARRAAGAHRGRAAAAHGGARRRRTSSTRSASSARASTTTTCPRSSTRCCSAASS